MLQKGVSGVEGSWRLVVIDRAREMIHERPEIYAKNMFRFETCWSKQCDQPDGCIFLNLPNNIIYVRDVRKKEG